MLAAGEELAEAARQALGADMQFEDISEYVPGVTVLKYMLEL